MHLSGVTQKLHRATHPADEMTSKAEALGDGAISWRTLQPSTEGRHSLKGSPWVMKAAPAERPSGPGKPRAARVQVQTLRAPGLPTRRHTRLLFWHLFLRTCPLSLLPPLARRLALHKRLPHPESVSSRVKASHYAYEVGLYGKAENILGARCQGPFENRVKEPLSRERYTQTQFCM